MVRYSDERTLGIFTSVRAPTLAPLQVKFTGEIELETWQAEIVRGKCVLYFQRLYFLNVFYTIFKRPVQDFLLVVFIYFDYIRRWCNLLTPIGICNGEYIAVENFSLV